VIEWNPWLVMFSMTDSLSTKHYHVMGGVWGMHTPGATLEKNQDDREIQIRCGIVESLELLLTMHTCYIVTRVGIWLVSFAVFFFDIRKHMEINSCWFSMKSAGSYDRFVTN
jgi:hypothetical protein